MKYLSNRNFIGFVDGEKVYFEIGGVYDLSHLPKEYNLWLSEIHIKEEPKETPKKKKGK